MTSSPTAFDPPRAAESWRSAIDEAIDARREALVRMRRRLHATPEASEHETATTALVAEVLREAGLAPRVMDGGIGVLADLDLGAGDGTFIALRAELDCVIVQDEKQVPYASTRDGLCHACGHDAHTTIVVAAAQALAGLRDELAARGGFRHGLRFVFQPAEETSTGARMMIRQGALDGVESILAVHVDPFLDRGRIGLRVGPLTSACKSFRIVVRGRSGHSARPHEALDPIPAAVNIVSLLYQLAPRSIDSRHPLSLTVGQIAAGATYNAIPSEAVVGGTLRTTRTEDTAAIQSRMEAVVASVAQATGCAATLEFPHTAPATDNDPAIIDAMADEAARLLGTDGVRFLDLPSLGAEDFGFFQELVPGAIVRLGTGSLDGRPRHPLHSGLFDIDEAALPIGAKFLARCGLRLARG